MIKDKYMEVVPCPEGCKVVRTGTKWLGQRRSEDIDAYYYDVINETTGEVVASHEVRAATNIYRPRGERIYLFS